MEIVDHVIPVLAQHRAAGHYDPDLGRIPRCSCGTFGLPVADSTAEQGWQDAHVAGLVVDALRTADLLWEPSPPRCEDERLRPGGYPTRNWDWVKCDEDRGHDGEHENNETGLHWADDAPQYL